MGGIRGVIWDVDGTLSDTLSLCVSGLQHAIASHGGPSLEPEEVRALFGPTEEGILASVLGDEAEAAARTYLDHYREGHEAENLAFDGIGAIVAELHRRGVPQAVVTGKGEASAMITLQALGLDSFFDPIVAGSVEGSIKAAAITSVLERWGMSPSAVAYVGDAPSDVREARSAGVVPVVAAWKSDIDLARLTALRPEALLEDAPSLEAWLEANLA